MLLLLKKRHVSWLKYLRTLSSLIFWAKVIAEKRATFSCTAELKRPSKETLIPNLYLAGDYVTSGCVLNEYPATIESAVRSGVACAAQIARQVHTKS